MSAAIPGGRPAKIMDKNVFFNLFASFDRSGPAEQFAALRQAARKRFQNAPLPSSRSEDWRFTNVTPILETPWELPLPDQTIDVRRVPAPATPSAIRLVFANGRLLDVVSKHGKLPAGVKIDSLAESLKAPESLAKIADEESVFTALNTSLLEDGALIVVPDGQVVEAPIEIIYLSEPTARPLMTQPRTL